MEQTAENFNKGLVSFCIPKNAIKIKNVRKPTVRSNIPQKMGNLLNSFDNVHNNNSAQDSEGGLVSKCIRSNAGKIQNVRNMIVSMNMRQKMGNLLNLIDVVRELKVYVADCSTISM